MTRRALEGRAEHSATPHPPSLDPGLRRGGYRGRGWVYDARSPAHPRTPAQEVCFTQRPQREGETQTFALGGGQEGRFTVTGRNTGPVAVTVLGKAEGAATGVMRATVAPGASLEATFASGEGALLRNTSQSKTAQLKLRITGDTSALGMGYVPNP